MSRVCAAIDAKADRKVNISKQRGDIQAFFVRCIAGVISNTYFIVALLQDWRSIDNRQRCLGAHFKT